MRFHGLVLFETASAYNIILNSAWVEVFMSYNFLLIKRTLCQHGSLPNRMLNTPFCFSFKIMKSVICSSMAAHMAHSKILVEETKTIWNQWSIWPIGLYIHQQITLGKLPKRISARSEMHGWCVHADQLTTRFPLDDVPNHRCRAVILLTHWGRVTHICVSKLTIIGSDNGLSPGRRQAIIWTNDGILLIGTLGTNFSKILIGIRIFSFKKMGLRVTSAKWRPFCLGLNVLITQNGQ